MKKMGWTDNEMAHKAMGDERLDRRIVNIIERLENSSECSFTQCFKSRAELVAAYRFFDNNFVTPEKILSSHYESTISRIKQQKVVLLPNDTSSIDYTGKTSVEGLGILETAYTKGIFIHPLLAIIPDRTCLGVIDVQMWTRDGEAHRKSLPSQVRKNEPIKEKESFRWIHSYRKACILAQQIPQTQFICIGDRESDILELIVEAVQTKEKGNGADIIIRINHDRKLAKENKNTKSKKNTGEGEVGEIALGNEEEKLKLKKKLTQAPKLGEIEFVIPSRDGKPERIVKQTLRAKKIQLNSKKVGDQKYPSVMVNALCCIEENPPLCEDPICWMFFTTLPIDSFEQIVEVIKYYLCRWEIEVFFKILKSGCKVEERELKSAERIKNMLALFFILAWRIQYIMVMGRKHPEISCSEVFEEAEWKSVYKIIKKSAIPETPPTLGELILMIARLGGYLTGKNRPPPGPKIMWRGMRRMSDFALAWESFG
jgi:hypothetical protein